MKNKIILLSFLLSFSYGATDIDIAAQAMNKAIQAQVKYETLQLQQEQQIKELKKEVGDVKLEGMIKDLLIVILATIKITHSI